MFSRVVNRETVLSFKVDPTIWTEEDQKTLDELMTLEWKENPDWTEEQARNACRKKVDDILYEKFEKDVGFLVEEANVYGYTLDDAFETFRKEGLYVLVKQLNQQIGLTKFYELFYDDLREMWNIDTVGMEEEYEMMKKNGWSFSQYRQYLRKQQKKQRETYAAKI